MAIRQRKGRKKAWEVYWNNPFTLKRESLYVKTEEEAIKHDALKKYQLKFERELFRREEITSAVVEHTLESAYYMYLKEKKFSKKSLAWQLDAMKTPLTMLGNKEVSDITSSDLQAIKQSMLGVSNIKQVTVRNRLSVLRTVMRWMYNREYIQTLPKFPELPPAAYKHIVPPTEQELSLLWDNSPEHIRRVIVLGAMLGMRVGPSEAFKLRWSDVDIPRRLVRVQAARKNILEPWREVPIHASLVGIMREWEEKDREESILFVVNYRREKVDSIKHAWESAIKRAGIRKVTPYSLRHKFATDLLAEGVDPGTVAKLMGHRSTDMIFAHYQHVITEQKRRAIEALPEIQSSNAYVAENMWQNKNGLHVLM